MTATSRASTEENKLVLSGALSSGVLICLIVFFVALGLRVVFVLQWNDTPYGATPLLDANIYHEWAQEIANGALLRERAFYHSSLQLRSA